MIGTILTILWIVSAIGFIGTTIYYIYDARPKSEEEQLNELAEACRYYMEKHPEVLDPYRTNRYRESEKNERS